jgi:hypothetical protein
MSYTVPSQQTLLSGSSRRANRYYSDQISRSISRVFRPQETEETRELDAPHRCKRGRRRFLLQGMPKFACAPSQSIDFQTNQVSGFEVFKRVLDDQRSLPPGQSTKDLLTCINYILRKFFKNLQQNPLLAVEAFWPKPRGQLRKLSGRDSDEDDASDGNDQLPKVRIISFATKSRPCKLIRMETVACEDTGRSRVQGR